MIGNARIFDITDLSSAHPHIGNDTQEHEETFLDIMCSRHTLTTKQFKVLSQSCVNIVLGEDHTILQWMSLDKYSRETSRSHRINHFSTLGYLATYHMLESRDAEICC